MVRLSPPERIGEFFGIYGLVGKGSQVIGQLLYGADPVPVPRLARRTAPTRSRCSACWSRCSSGVADLARSATTGPGPARRSCRRIWVRSPRPSGCAGRGAARASLGSVAVAAGWPGARPRPSRPSPRGSGAAGASRAPPPRASTGRRARVDRPLDGARCGPGWPPDHALRGREDLADAEAAAVAEVADQRLGRSADRPAPWPRSRERARRPGRRHGCSRGCTSRPGWGSRRRRSSASGRPRPRAGRSG